MHHMMETPDEDEQQSPAQDEVTCLYTRSGQHARKPKTIGKRDAQEYRTAAALRKVGLQEKRWSSLCDLHSETQLPFRT